MQNFVESFGVYAVCTQFKSID